MTTITADYFRTASLPSRSWAASESDFPRRQVTGSVAASAMRSRGAAELGKILHECDESGWDGYDALPVLTETAIRTFAFVYDLPEWMQAPDIIPEADGEIALEWFIAPELTFSVSIGHSGPIHYAGLFGDGEEIHGVAPYSFCVPESVLQMLAKLFRKTTARRAA